MTTQNDEKALIALIATTLHPDAQQDLTREEVETLLAQGEGITKEERSRFEGIDPLSLIREPESKPAAIPFPTWATDPELPMAAGFYRGGDEENADQETRDSVKRKRAAIREQLHREHEEPGDSEHND
jgi:hypothetical protein